MKPESKWVTRKRLMELYVDQGMSQAQVARELGVCQMTVCNHLRRYGITTRKVERKSAIAEDQLRELYEVQGLTQEAIGEQLGVSQSVVGDYLKAYGIETRHVGLPPQVILPEEELRRLYRDEGWTYPRLAEHFHCGHGTLLQNIKRYGLQMTKVEKKRNQRKRSEKRFPLKTRQKGYEMRHVPDHPNATKWGYVFEHRLVLEAAIGHSIDPKQPVHHINAQRDDNRLENLALLNNHAEHMRVHAYLERLGLYQAELVPRPEPLTFKAPVFWGGKYVTSIDLAKGPQDASQAGGPSGDGIALDKKELIN